MSEEKIRFYQEVLELDPGSKVFFPLASLYFKQDQVQKARETLASGLKKDPLHFEARLLMAEIHNLQGEADKAGRIYSDIFSLLRKYPDFWENLSLSLRADGQKDLALAAAFFARSGMDGSITWADILQSGLDSILSRAGQSFDSQFPGQQQPEDTPEPLPENTGLKLEPDSPSPPEAGQPEAETSHPSIIPQPPVDKDQSHVHLDRALESGVDQDHDARPQTDQDGQDKWNAVLKSRPDGSGIESDLEDFEEPEELEDFAIEDEARTRSMADVLLGQEEFGKALDIYRELWRRSLPGDERKELETIIARTEQAMSTDDRYRPDPARSETPQKDRQDRKREAADFLKSLADRLEARSA